MKFHFLLKTKLKRGGTNSMRGGVCKSYSKIEPNYHLPCTITVNNTFKWFLSSLATIIYALRLQFRRFYNKKAKKRIKNQKNQKNTKKRFFWFVFYCAAKKRVFLHLYVGATEWIL